MTEILIIKQIALRAIFSDDIIMNKLVLKGGNAIDLVYGISGRASWDLDFSIENTFTPEEIDIIKQRLHDTLLRTFNESGYKVFDFSFFEVVKETIKGESFWGGYEIDFKIIKNDLFVKMVDINERRKYAVVVDNKQGRKLNISISKHEYCQGKEERILDGLKIYLYTPEMIVIEKLRAICQQMPEYLSQILKSYSTPRAKDFFDITILIKHYKINLLELHNRELIEQIFNCKKVPLSLLSKIKNYKDYHSAGYASLRDTVYPGIELLDFDYYFNFVTDEVEKLHTFWDK